MPSEIKIADLRAILNGILDHIEGDLQMPVVSLQGKNYWEVLDRYNVNAPDSERLGVGSLSDDWGFAERLLKFPHERRSIMLTHLAPILQAIGDEVRR